MDTSVVLSTWDNALRLEQTLSALARCRVAADVRWELIVVANACEDDTVARARSFQDRLPIRVVEEPEPGLSHARNRGLAAAEGRLVVFTDDDVEPVEAWVQVYTDASRAHAGKPVYFGGPIVSDFEAGPPSEDLAAFAPCSVTGYDRGTEEGELDDYFLGANWGCPRTLLEEAGGFSTSLGIRGSEAPWRVGEETELQAKLRERGCTPYYLPGARLTHFVPARKCTWAHIGDRREGEGFLYTLRDLQDGPGLPHRVAGVPRRLWRKGLRTWLRIVRLRASGRLDVQTYMDWRFLRGRIRAYREDARQRRGGR